MVRNRLVALKCSIIPAIISRNIVTSSVQHICHNRPLESIFWKHNNKNLSKHILLRHGFPNKLFTNSCNNGRFQINAAVATRSVPDHESEIQTSSKYSKELLDPITYKKYFYDFKFYPNFNR